VLFYQATLWRFLLGTPAYNLDPDNNPITQRHRIAEKFVSWSDETPSLDIILEAITLYWVTNTFPTSIWNYREVSIAPAEVSSSSSDYHAMVDTSL
jgi:hypothetical protein